MMTKASVNRFGLQNYYEKGVAQEEGVRRQRFFLQLLFLISLAPNLFQKVGFDMITPP